MTREEAIYLLNNLRSVAEGKEDEAIDMAIEALSAEAEPIVIISKTLMPTKDFKEWAKRIREVNPNAVVIPCDAEVVSADVEWIPCSERLPKEDARYLVQMSYGIMRVLSWANILEKVDDFDFCNEKHSGWYEYDSEWGYYESREVIAWMPLPKPYKGGDDE